MVEVQPHLIDESETNEASERPRADGSEASRRRGRRTSSSKSFRTRVRDYVASPKRIHILGMSATIAVLPLIATTLMIHPNPDRTIEVAGQTMRLDDAWTLLSAKAFWERQRDVQHEKWQTSLASLNHVAAQRGISPQQFESILRGADTVGLIERVADAQHDVRDGWIVHEQSVDVRGTEQQVIDFLTELNRSHPNCRPVCAALHLDHNDVDELVRCRIAFRYVSLSPEALS